MSNILAVRYPSSVTSSTPTDWGVEIIGFQPSGLSNGNLLGVACYDYDYATNVWCPMSH